MGPIARETIASRIEGFEPLDTLADPLRNAVHKALPEDSPVRDALSGTWLGHPLHPLLTDVGIGAWTSALVLDLAGVDGGADLLVGVGAAAAVPTALSGLSDWADLVDESRRVGAVHAVGNTAALLLHVASLVDRCRGRRVRGRALSALGMGAAMGSAWLGGHLSFGRGVGVNQT